MANITFDPDFDGQLDKLGDYHAGYHIVFHPERDVPEVTIEPYRQGETPSAIWHNRAFVLWAKPNALAKADLFKEYLQEHLGTLQLILDNYECRWDGSNYRGFLTETAQRELEGLQYGMEEYFQHDLPSYWEARDWFSPAPPEKDDRDAEGLVADALSEGVYLDKEDVQSYLDQLVEEEAEEAA